MQSAVIVFLSESEMYILRELLCDAERDVCHRTQLIYLHPRPFSFSHTRNDSCQRSCCRRFALHAHTFASIGRADNFAKCSEVSGTINYHACRPDLQRVCMTDSHSPVCWVHLPYA